MNETDPQGHEPDSVPSDEQLDVEGPNESGQPSGAPGLDEDDDAADDQAEQQGEA